jgi:hypothetical protein
MYLSMVPNCWYTHPFFVCHLSMLNCDISNLCSVNILSLNLTFLLMKLLEEFKTQYDRFLLCTAPQNSRFESQSHICTSHATTDNPVYAQAPQHCFSLEHSPRPQPHGVPSSSQVIIEDFCTCSVTS